MSLRIGIDLGGTKIEAIALDDAGAECARLRVATPQSDYPATVAAIAELVATLDTRLGVRARVGVGTPGAPSAIDGRMKNANSTCLNGQPLHADLTTNAAVNGEPDGPPLLPPIALTDEVTALTAAFATMVALHSGRGQVVDVNLLESLVQLMGPLLSLWELRGELQPRLGSGIPYSVPRGTYRCADDRWVAISTSAESVAVRVMDLIGLGDDPRYAGFAGRIAHRDEIDAALGAWCAARPLAEVLATFEEANAAAAPVYDMAGLAADPHVAARGTVVEVDGTPMQGLVARLAETPGRLRWAGRPLGADTSSVWPDLDR